MSALSIVVAIHDNILNVIYRLGGTCFYVRKISCRFYCFTVSVQLRLRRMTSAPLRQQLEPKYQGTQPFLFCNRFTQLKPEYHHGPFILSCTYDRLYDFSFINRDRKLMF